jgi:hypothetical protein
MSNNPNQHILQATDKRLAEMIRQFNQWFNQWRRSYEIGIPMPFTAEELEIILDEAARRLDSYQHRETFNHEAFE